MPKSWGGEMRALLALGIPMAAAQFVQYLVFFFDTAMIGRISPEDVAAASLGSVIYFALWMLGSGPVMAVSPLVAQALGADQNLSLIHISEPTRLGMISYAVFCLKKRTAISE